MLTGGSIFLHKEEAGAAGAATADKKSGLSLPEELREDAVETSVELREVAVETSDSEAHNKGIPKVVADDDDDADKAEFMKEEDDGEEEAEG